MSLALTDRDTFSLTKTNEEDEIGKGCNSVLPFGNQLVRTANTRGANPLLSSAAVYVNTRIVHSIPQADNEYSEAIEFSSIQRIAGSKRSYL